MSRPGSTSTVAAHFDRSAQYWENIYSFTDVYSVIHQERRLAILQMVDALALPANARVLDVGCGAGHLAVELARRGFSVTAVDRSAAMVQQAIKNAQSSPVEATVCVQQWDIFTLDGLKQDASFDLVLAIGVIPWLPGNGAIEQAAVSLARMAKPGGHVITTVDHRWGWHRCVDIRSNPAVLWIKTELRGALEAAGFRKPVARAGTHSIRQLDGAVRQAGLQKTAGKTLGFGPFTFWNRNLLAESSGVKFHHRLQRRADQGAWLLRNGGAQYLICARKAESN